MNLQKKILEMTTAGVIGLSSITGCGSGDSSSPGSNKNDEKVEESTKNEQEKYGKVDTWAEKAYENNRKNGSVGYLSQNLQGKWCDDSEFEGVKIPNTHHLYSSSSFKLEETRNLKLFIEMENILDGNPMYSKFKVAKANTLTDEKGDYYYKIPESKKEEDVIYKVTIKDC